MNKGESVSGVRNAATKLSGFERKELPAGHFLWEGRLPEPLIPNAAGFEELWRLHPIEFHEIQIHGRLVKTPRWQQAYGMDYQYAGRINRALPIPVCLDPLFAWARSTIDEGLNGLLLNWYDGSLGHYIGRHRDSVANMIPGSPIVTISFGAERTFRLRRWGADQTGGPIDFRATNGCVFVMPWDTNLV